MIMIPYCHIKQTFLDEQGEPLAGGVLFFYDGDVPQDRMKNVWADPDCTQAASQPVILNREGSCSVYLTQAEPYRVRLQDAYGSTLWETGPITCP